MSKHAFSDPKDVTIELLRDQLDKKDAALSEARAVINRFWTEYLGECDSQDWIKQMASDLLKKYSFPEGIDP